MQEIIDFLKDPEGRGRLVARVPKGVLLGEARQGAGRPVRPGIRRRL